MEVISIYKTRKNLAEYKENIVLIKQFKKLIADLELASQSNSHVRLLSLKIKNSGYILYINEDFSQILGSLIGVVNDNQN